MYDIIELNGKLLQDLREIAKELSISKINNLKKQDLVYKILDQQALFPLKSETEGKSENKFNKNKRRRIESKPVKERIASSADTSPEAIKEEPKSSTPAEMLAPS